MTSRWSYCSLFLTAFHHVSSQRQKCQMITALQMFRRSSQALCHLALTSTPTGWSFCCSSSICWSQMCCCSTFLLPCSGKGPANALGVLVMEILYESRKVNYSFKSICTCSVMMLNVMKLSLNSYTFQVVQENADIFWKFQRYNLIVEYHSRPALAPPFIIISHISQALLSLVKTTETKQDLLGK